jgi:TolB protein
MDLVSKRLSRITHSFGADIEPDWTPDGRYLVFTSDRGGRPQIYKIAVGENGAAGRATRVTFDGKENLRPSVAPDGKRIAIVNNTEGVYRIAVLDTESSQLSILTEGRLDESPSFAPNGNMLIYAASGQGRGELVAVSSDGRASHKLRFNQGDVREPAWSPYKAD